MLNHHSFRKVYTAACWVAWIVLAILLAYFLTACVSDGSVVTTQSAQQPAAQATFSANATATHAAAEFDAQLTSIAATKEARP